MNSNSQNPISVSCDKCNTQFQINNLKTESIHHVPEHRQVVHTFFSCPSCGHSYTCYYTDKSIRAMQRKINAYRIQQAKSPSIARGDKMNCLSDDVKLAMDALREHVEAITS